MAGKKIEVLLLEGDEDAAVNAQTLLTALDCEVDHSQHPREALFGIKRDSPDLLLVALPPKGMTASSFLTNLQLVEDARGLPVIGLLDSSPGEDPSELLHKGLSDHLRKPISRDELARVIDRWGQVRRSDDATQPAEPPPTQPAKRNLFDKLRQELSVSSTKSVLQHETTGGRSTSVEADRDSNAALTDGEGGAAAGGGAEAQIPAAAEPEALAPKPSQPETPEIEGPKMEAQLDDGLCTMTIEMAMGESIVAWVGERRLEVGTEFSAQLAYQDPAPGRNRMIPVNLNLSVFSCNPAGEHSYRCVLKVETVRPAERWAQFVRVCKAQLEEAREPDSSEDSA